jgi:ribosomal protein S6--L-glutamate ligase
MKQGSSIAFSHRFKECPGVTLLRTQPNFSDYGTEEKKMIRDAEKVYYPTWLYVDLFITLGKKIFPSRETYVYSGDKIKQTALFQVLNIPHPRTRIYFGDQKKNILDEFIFPFIAKIPRGSSMGKGVFLIEKEEDLRRYLHRSPVAYIQEYVPLAKDLRVILIQHQVVLAYWKIASPGEFRNNLAQGAAISFDEIPQEALDLAEAITRNCNFDDVGLDLCHNSEKGWMVLEANMNYGIQGLKEKGLDIRLVLRDLMIQGKI